MESSFSSGTRQSGGTTVAMATVVHHQYIDYSRLDRAVSEWRALARLIAAPETQPELRQEYQRRLRGVRAELDAALMDLNRQRRAEIERWAAPHGLKVDWRDWERSPAPR
jgi:hypothetical protein